MAPSGLEVSAGLEYEVLVACPPLRPNDIQNQDAKQDPRVYSSDWTELKRQCLLDLESELGHLIAKEQERGEESDSLEELRRQRKNVQFISVDRMENINATQLAIARSLKNKGLPVCYTIGNPLGGQYGQPYDLYHFLSKPDQLDKSIPEWANCFTVKTDSTVLPKPADVYDKNEFEWAPIEVATPVFRGDVSQIGSYEIPLLCATLRDELLSWVNRSYDLHIHMSPMRGSLDLQTAKKLVIIIWLLEPTLYELTELNQDRRDDFQHKPITIHSMIARLDGYEYAVENAAEAASLLPQELHRFVQRQSREDIHKVYQLAHVFDAADIASLRRMIVGTNQQRLAINFRDFAFDGLSHDGGDGDGNRNRRPYSATIEFRFFTPTRDETYSRMCIRVAAAIFAMAGLESDPYRRKLSEIVRRLTGKKPGRWRDLLDVLDLGSEATAWENAKKQHCIDPRHPCTP
ncbi:hypothetical protein SLS62_001422 [Diatrype stigma]|uniref:Uncharacterized protein n=1 Tax=Diatrype stigma TaxID=117547 RepID=A0AAN9UW70_9PEZI